MKEILSKILPILVNAKEVLNERDINSEEKDGIGNIVTATDKKLDFLITDALKSSFPYAQIISEESSDDIKIENKTGLKFVVDPLGGTTNYTNGWPHTISIGIINNNELSGGIVYDVLSDKVYCGIKNHGVFYCDINDISNLKPVIKPNYKKENVKKSVISYDIPYGVEAFNSTLRMLSDLYNSGASLKTVGPTSLDLLKTALGEKNRPNDYNDANFHTEVRAWDLAGATAILRELGGEIYGKNGRPLSVEILSSPTDKIEFFASGNTKLLEELYEKCEPEEYIKRKSENNFEIR